MDMGTGFDHVEGDYNMLFYDLQTPKPHKTAPLGARNSALLLLLLASRPAGLLLTFSSWVLARKSNPLRIVSMRLSGRGAQEST